MFKDRALPLAERGIPVIPVLPGEKRCVLEDWPNRATIDRDQIEKWNLENPLYNVGCVGQPDGIVILDCDKKGLMRQIEEETGHRFPRTMIVKSGGKGAAHVYFRQNDWSRKLGNRKVPGLFDLQSIDKYVVGPGSLLSDGGEYRYADDSPIAEFPQWLTDWIESKSVADKPHAKGKGSEVAEHFDFDKLCTHYRLEVESGKNGKWPLPCPFKGDWHTNNGQIDKGATCIFYDGERLGFSCLATSCSGCGKSFGDLIHFLNQTHEPYPCVIWPQVSDAEAMSWAEVEPADIPSEKPKPDEPTTDEPELIEYSSQYDTENTVTRSLMVLGGDQIKPEKFEWLWHRRIAKNAITLMVGSQGVSKSVVGCDIIARTTRGNNWPDGAENPWGPMDVLCAFTEDHLEQTVIPRLIAAGADRKRIHVIRLVKVTQDEGGDANNHKFQLKAHLKLLAKSLREHPEVGLIFLDPLTGFFGDADSNKDKDMRPLLEDVSAVLNKYNVALVGITHINKKADLDAVQRTLGASSITGVARAAWQFTRDPRDKTKRIMAGMKGNNAPETTALRYQVVGDMLPSSVTGANEDIETCHVVWDEDGGFEATADDILKELRDKRKEKPEDTKQAQSVEFLRARFAESWQWRTSELYRLGEVEGLSVDALKRARHALAGELPIDVDDRRNQHQGYWWVVWSEDRRRERLDEALAVGDVM